ncbi:MAG TPA: NfeD family protein [Pirellulaceae bacterium]|jgi:membrane protein implicated in regulation of membrane protease activity|nr:NfeD family protein [Pirellulaceae bacterium]
MLTLFTFFLLCAIAGGAVLLVQLLGTVLGLGGDSFDGADLDLDHPDGDSGILFGLVSFRTLVAALTFFGLFGLLGNSLELPPFVQVTMGSMGGMVALLIVWWLMRTMRQLGQDSTIRLEAAIGSEATVYTVIPGASRGAGKVMLNYHGRVEEYAATTAYPESLTSGTRVRIVNVHGGSTLEVEPVVVGETARVAAV